MKTTVLSVLGCVLIATGALQAQAQTGTNVTLGVNIALTGVAPTNTTSGVARVRITTKDVLNAIGAETSNTFGPRARLLIVFPSGGSPSFVVRDGTNDTAVDTGILSVNRGTTVKSERTSSTGLVAGTENAIDNIVLATGTLSFNVQGYSTDSSSNRGITGHTILDDKTPVSYSSHVNGTGSGDSVLQGTISASGRKVELVP